MEDEIIKSLMDLVGIPSVRYNEEAYREAAEYITKLIEREIPEASIEIIEAKSDYASRERVVPNILAYVDAGSDKTVALVSHYDVVEAYGPREIEIEGKISFDPFKATKIGNLIYGRGAADDKSAIVASIYATKRALKDLKKNVLLVIVGDEEIGGKAGIYAVKDKVIDVADEVIVIDGYYRRVANGASGVISLELKVKGRQGHAGYPFLADNPVHKLINLLHTTLHSAQVELFGSYIEIEAADFLDYITQRLSVTVLSAGGGSTNIIPREAIARLDFRYIYDDVKAAEDMIKRKLLASAIANGIDPRDVEIIVRANHPSRYVPKETPLVKEFKEIAEKITGEPHSVGVERGGNDGFIFARAGLPTITYGAMLPESNIHAPLENLNVDVLYKVINVLEAFLRGERYGSRHRDTR